MSENATARFEFAGLSWQSFEQLIQALSLQVIGDVVTPFGTGPDGGRDATFDGLTNYGPEAAAWSGYGVIQAKFLSQPRTTSANAAWVLKTLRDELARIKHSSRRRPNYYIFATNVALSAASGGGKDRVIKVLEEFAREQGLAGWDLWDFDKLAGFLTIHDSIRKNYAAWITAGDLLAELAASLRDNRPDFPTLLTRFLQKELIRDQFARLEQAGHSADEAIPLASVFVDLPTADRPDGSRESTEDDAAQHPGFVKTILDLAAHRFSPRIDTDPRSSSREARELGGRFVLIGGPGQGKTTVGQYLCQLFRVSLLTDAPQRFLSEDAQRAIDLLREQSKDEGLGIPKCRRFPFRIVLSEFAAALDRNEAGSVMDFVTNTFNSRANTTLLTSEFETFFSQYPCIIVFDGLDEVPPSTNRDEVLQAIREFWVDVSSLGIDALVVATSRPQGYNEDFTRRFYQHLWLQPLEPDRALRYGGRLTDVRFGSDPQRVEKVKDRLKRASDQEATARLMRSPLQITIMTLLVDRMGQPPEERWNLFQAYYNLIYSREIEKDIPAAMVLRSHRANIDTIHRRVALLLQVESERSGGTEARLTSEQFARIVHDRLDEEGHTGTNLLELAAAVTQAADQRLVFLVGLEVGRVGFEIRSLQEFMAAEALMDGPDELVRARLQHIAGIANWRNVFLFAAGKCFSERQHLRDTVTTICSRLNEDPYDPGHRVTLAGSDLALDLLQDGSPLQQPNYSRILFRIALKLLQLPKYRQHVALAAAFQPGVEDIYFEELTAAWDSGNEEYRAAVATCLVGLHEAGAAEFDHLIRALLTVDSLRDETLFFHVFSELTSYNPWTADLLLQSAISIGPYPVMEAFEGAEISWKSDPGLENLRTTAPPWLSALGDLASVDNPVYHSAGELEIRVLPSVLITLRSVVASPPQQVVDLQSVPHAGPAWHVVRAAADFAISPSRETLVSALEAAAEVADAPEVLVYLLPYIVPWPLRACLDSAEDDPSRLQIFVEQAKEGRLGDYDAWVRAESNWATSPTMNVRGGRDDGLPFDLRASKAGLPFASARPQSVPAGVPTKRQLIREIGAASSVCAREFLVRCLVLSHGHKPWVREFEYGEDERIVLLTALRSSGLKREGIGLVAAMINFVLDPELVDALDEVGRTSGRFVIYGLLEDAPHLQDAVAAAAEMKPGGGGLWWLLALMAREPGFDFDRVGIPPPSDDPLIQAARDVLQVSRGNVQLLTVDSLKTLAADEDLAQACLAAAESGAYSHEELEELLLRLLRASHDGSDTSQYLLSRLVDKIRQRTSSLAVGDVWNRLGFPTHLREVLTPPDAT